MSSQLEYHRLLNRMKLLEKQKEQKSRLINEKTTPAVLKIIPPQAEANFTSLTVIVQNENRIIQTKKASETDSGLAISTTSDTSKILNVNKLPTSKTPATTTNTSLAKRVLVKNAIESLVSSKVPIDEIQNDAECGKVPAAAKPVITAATQASVEDQQPSNSASENKADTETKSAPLSLEAFAKKSPKIKASVLANYVKKYRSHGLVY